ncbi:hypothetical protein RA19_18650 [Leisingera sp. ANG-M1]|uniref:hypothetical protein n=1 Tax=Leisingera sp. ANG-M1 TaxID=1577895 RepID=UPI00057CB205|nr:hypothetical protein [Leisingera sp. ANG-M1]KIC08871.1 hypothetical protein RA19_18650 [Leisingera sp. ANG-M1]
MKKDKRRLVLTGTDDLYAKKEALIERPLSDSSKETSPQPDIPVEEIETVTSLPVTSEQTPATDPLPGARRLHPGTGKAIQVNFRLNLGKDLSKRLQQLAEAHGQPLEPILKGLRIKAADRFKSLAAGQVKPVVPAPDSGGLYIRHTATYTGDIARVLNQWFDPFGLGIAKDACKPILTQLLQEEARVLCEVNPVKPIGDL